MTQNYTFLYRRIIILKKKMMSNSIYPLSLPHQSHGLNKHSTSNVRVPFIVLAIIINNNISLHPSIIHILIIREMPSIMHVSLSMISGGVASLSLQPLVIRSIQPLFSQIHIGLVVPLAHLLTKSAFRSNSSTPMNMLFYVTITYNIYLIWDMGVSCTYMKVKIPQVCDQLHVRRMLHATGSHIISSLFQINK